MSKLVNGNHQVEPGERRKAETEHPKASPLVQQPGTEVGQETLAHYRWITEEPASQNGESHGSPRRQQEGHARPRHRSRGKRGLAVENRRRNAVVLLNVFCSSRVNSNGASTPLEYMRSPALTRLKDIPRLWDSAGIRLASSDQTNG
jgi:hypothetical protein